MFANIGQNANLFRNGCSVVFPFCNLYIAVCFPHLYGTRITTCAKAWIKSYNINFIWLWAFVPAYLSCSILWFNAFKVNQFGWSNKCFIIDNKFAIHLSTKTFNAQYISLFFGPVFISVGMFSPISSVCFKSVNTKLCFVAVAILSFVCTFPNKCKLIFITVRCACNNSATTCTQCR